MSGFIKDLLKRFKSKDFWLVIGTSIATALGAFGGLPDPPQTFKNIIRDYPFVKWILMYILILQGGSGFDYMFALISTVIVWLIYNAVTFFEKKNPISPIIDNAVQQIKEEAKAKVEQVANAVRQENFYQAEAEEQFRPREEENRFQPAAGGFGGGPGY